MRERYIVEMDRTITNPDKDGRSRDWHKRPTIPAGARFKVRTHMDETPNGIEFEVVTIELSSTPDRLAYRGYGLFGRAGRGLGEMILASSHRVPARTVGELAFVHDCDYGGDTILATLLKLGRISGEDFAAVAAALDAEAAEEERRHETRTG
ncbi:MAG: hypothetical protein J2P48_18620 [Alphaproteobacteria bacterium]|nr:hypothetical protein [Alphaproteobacteria bacterium]